MNWLDESVLYSQIGVFLREDLGRGDITSQAIIERNTRARGRFLAGERMIVAGLEAAEEVFLTLDSQQELESFVSEGEEIEAGKVICRLQGFADVLLAGERVALNLMQRLSATATLTNRFVQAVEGTKAAIYDTRQTTPGMRMLEKYAVMLGGGRSRRLGLDDGVVITANHVAVAGGIATAVKNAQERLGRLHKVEVECASENEIEEALNGGADMLLFGNQQPSDLARLVSFARESAPPVIIEYSGSITLEKVRAYAETGVDVISVPALTSAPLMDITFQIQPG
jgi:nicotinate-nucleotide pyrophosphorylase (carboxylating)